MQDNRGQEMSNFLGGLLQGIQKAENHYQKKKEPDNYKARLRNQSKEKSMEVGEIGG